MIATVRLNEFLARERFGRHVRRCPPRWRLKRSISQRDIRCALERGDLVEEEYDQGPARRSHRWHAGRIAYFVAHGWSEPLVVEVKHSETIIEDGNHRLRAAIYRGDEYISFRVLGDLVLFEARTGILLSSIMK